MNTATLYIYASYDPSELIATITRDNKRMCVKVAKAHYSGTSYIWVWK